MNDHYLEILKKIISKNIPEEEYIVFLFGSRAGKTNHDRSDIDVGVWGTKVLDPLVRANLESEIEDSIIPYLVDIVDFSLVNESFKKEALQHIVLWNCPTNLKPILKT